MSEEIQKAIKTYLAVVFSKEDSESDAIEKLMQCLDTLALLSHGVRYIADETEYPDPPEKNYKEVRARICERFPSLGYYNTALDVSEFEKVGHSELGVGDAIDDIVDITLDLTEVLWHFENTSVNNALAQFEFGFRVHWGMHLRELQLYLHDRH